LKLGVITIHDMNIKKMQQKNAIKKSLFTRQRGVKKEYFYRLRVKNSNHLHTELSFGHLKDAKFILKAKLHLLT